MAAIRRAADGRMPFGLRHKKAPERSMREGKTFLRLIAAMMRIVSGRRPGGYPSVMRDRARGYATKVHSGYSRVPENT